MGKRWRMPLTLEGRTRGEMRNIPLALSPFRFPKPFASVLKDHLHNRPNLRTAGGIAANPWLFPRPIIQEAHATTAPL